MPWETGTVEESRARFVLEAENTFLSFSELCRRHGIARKTGYKWVDRYRTHGLDGLSDRSHRPESCPHATPAWVVERIIELRKRRRWGAKKLRKLLLEENGWAPCRDTVHRILLRHDLVKRGKPRRRRTHPGEPPFESDRPNAVWTVDFKGEFRLGDKRMCYPLTVQDAHSRFLLAIRAQSSTTIDETLPWFRRVFQRYGLPDRIRSDNGLPFASRALGRLSRLSAWWVQLGIRPETIEPGKPQQNPRHERMHRTLKERTAKPPSKNLCAQQTRFERFRKTYNEERPHEALGQERPASFYEPSKRRLPRTTPRVRYPGHFEVRKVASDKTIKWRDRKVFVSGLLRFDYVGLEEIGEGTWAVYYGPVFLGWLDEDDYRIMDVRGVRRRV
jgi:transposase InsO family protein